MLHIPERWRIQISFSSREELPGFVEKWKITYGDHFPLKHITDQHYLLTVTVTADQAAAIQNAGWKFTVLSKQPAQQIALEKLVGRGDRFHGGKIIPSRLVAPGPSNNQTS